jgi:hypothetical protein
MSADIRVDTDFPNHRKTKKLIQKLGFSGPTHLLFLWVAISKSRPKGKLEGMDVADIALDAQWPGDAKEFVDALMFSGYLEKNGDDVYLLHGWADHQPWVYYSDERSETARQNIMKRWTKRTTRKRKEYRLNTDSIETVYGSDTPSPFPFPIPLPNPNQIPPLIEWVTEYCKERQNGIDSSLWFDHYTGNGWMIGKNKMKDWRAAVRTWEHNKAPQGQGTLTPLQAAKKDAGL